MVLNLVDIIIDDIFAFLVTTKMMNEYKQRNDWLKHQKKRRQSMMNLLGCFRTHVPQKREIVSSLSQN